MNPEDSEVLVRYRLEEARAALEDAKFLIEGHRSIQSIVNRSYYAMFYAVLALLQRTGNIPSKHSGVISIFDIEFAQRGVFPKELSKDLHKAFELRQVSDYKVSEQPSIERAEELWNRAFRFVKSVSEYLGDNSAQDDSNL